MYVRIYVEQKNGLNFDMVRVSLFYTLFNIFIRKNNETIFFIFFFQEYTLIDDTVLEEHYEDPKLTQMKLVGGKEGKIIKILTLLD